MSSTFSNLLILAAVAVGAPLSASAQVELDDRLMACSGEQNDTLRLACYDREVARLAARLRSEAQPGSRSQPESPRDSGMQSHAAPAAAAATESATPATSAQESFGVQGGALARERADVTSAPQLERLTATVTAIARQPRGEMIFSLDNGQVWQQKEAHPDFPVETGEAVTISRGALNSFRLTVGGRSTAVTRIK